jgi:hypothetical protein
MVTSNGSNDDYFVGVFIASKSVLMKYNVMSFKPSNYISIIGVRERETIWGRTKICPTLQLDLAAYCLTNQEKFSTLKFKKFLLVGFYIVYFILPEVSYRPRATPREKGETANNISTNEICCRECCLRTVVLNKSQKQNYLIKKKLYNNNNTHSVSLVTA